MKIKNWKRSVLDRDFWKKIVERTKTHAELLRLLRRRRKYGFEYELLAQL